MSIIGCAGSDEGPGANFTPPTLGEFMKKQQNEQKLLRESRAGSQVAHEARKFHEKQALRYGLHTNRGLAHFHASKVYSSTREGNRLQEMFENGGQLGELPPKAIMRANKSAMKFHKGQAEKAGLDSDLGHAHVAAMEHHADILKKAKAQAQQKPIQASVEGGPGSGPHKGSASHTREQHIEKQEAKGFKLVKKGQYPNGTLFHDMKSPSGKTVRYQTYQRSKEFGDHPARTEREALPGHGSKQSPVPVPKKSQMPNGDVHDPTKPPVSLKPEDANKPMRKLQQGEEGGPGSGPRKGFGGTRRENKAFKRLQKKMSPELKDKIANELDMLRRQQAFQKWNNRPGNKKREAAIRNFGKESNVRKSLDDGLGHHFPKGAGRQVEPFLVHRDPRTKESRRRRHL